MTNPFANVAVTIGMDASTKGSFLFTFDVTNRPVPEGYNSPNNLKYSYLEIKFNAMGVGYLGNFALDLGTGFTVDL
jgi:hypothetical protein